MNHSELITLLHRHHAIARDIHWLLEPQTPLPTGWMHPLEALRHIALHSHLTREAELLEALVAVQVVSHLKAEVAWARRHQAGQTIHPEGRWQ